MHISIDIDASKPMLASIKTIITGEGSEKHA
jgi:hypothetical protein